ncbi:MarR family winged helix-turn-helix transcriptional regulator [Cryptosporangium phraense]|uniref:MarR family transcriptional regulator n=1 Tax=Cryptosporangium phraense TaxID=2593070 RepID=A0A545ARW5_9ACTN|nr:MarR family transcriptional regulator [Cryptosporangium phraense]TQS43991.1 MarR family transcriptional regulator [Cryptosporangium phraense]
MDVTPGAQLMPVLGQLIRIIRQTDPSDGVSLVALAVLRRLESEGPGRISELARVERASQPGMTQLVGRLERADLVRRIPDPHDGRGVLVELTDGGREQLARTAAGYAATLDALLSRLDADDRAAVAAAIPALRRLAAVPAGAGGG